MPSVRASTQPPAAMRVGEVGEADVADRAACPRRSGSARGRAAGDRPDRRRGRRRRRRRRLRRGGGRPARVAMSCGSAHRSPMPVGPSASGLSGARDRKRCAASDPPAPAGARRASAHPPRTCPRPTRIASCARPLEMRVRARRGAGDPPALARRQRDPAVERGGELERDVRAAERLPGQEARHRAPRRRPRRRPSTTAIPASRSRAKPRPAVRGSGSVSAATTRAGRAATSRSAQAGPRALSCAQGSSVT